MKSNKLKEIQVGRTLEFPATEGKKATAIKVTDVKQYQSTVEVTGVKISKTGKLQSRGVAHTYLVQPGQFLVTVPDAAPVVAVETSAEEAPVE